MMMKIKKMIFNVFLCAAFSYALSGEVYKPDIGDNIIMIYNLFENKSLNGVSEFFTKTYRMNFSDQEMFKKILYLKDLDNDRIFIIAFCKSGGNADAKLSDDRFESELKSKFIANTFTVNFRLLSLNSESYQPKIGDFITIWEYYYKTGSLNSAINSFNETIYPLLQDETQTKKSYLLYQKKMNTYAGITMLSEMEDDLTVMEKKINLLNLYFDKSTNMKTYRVLRIE